MLDARTRIGIQRAEVPALDHFLCLPPKPVASAFRNVLAYGLWYSCVDETAHLSESCIYLHRRRTAFPIKGAPPERTFKLTIVHPSYHTSTYLRAHQQAYLIRGTECTGQEVTDVRGSNTHSHYSLYSLNTLLIQFYSLHTHLSLYRLTQYIDYTSGESYPEIYFVLP